ncbi:MAG: hypothetical protein N3G20_04055, partial [Verrucomicrobiae bacterium]|nr:hypothetical protein [Verrucomicrobiae bacterium]
MNRRTTTGLCAAVTSAVVVVWRCVAGSPALAPTIDLRPAAVQARNVPALLQAPAGEASLQNALPRQLHALNQLRQRLPNVKVSLDRITGSPRLISAGPGACLTGPNGSGSAISRVNLDLFPADDPHRVVKAFIKEHSDLFGHGPENLDESVVS